MIKIYNCLIRFESSHLFSIKYIILCNNLESAKSVMFMMFL